MTQTDQEFGTFFLPGPTEVRGPVLRAMLGPMIGHRSAAFEELFARIQRGLQHVFRTSRPVYMTASSATGMMEAAIRCAPTGRILSLTNGAFSERFANIARACGRDVDRYDVEWGQFHDPAVLAERLQDGPYAAITVAHSETSTGVLNDIRTITSVARGAGVCCLTDSVSGIAGAELQFDAWNCDYVLTGSQKAIAIPPGLAFAAASEEFVEAARTIPNRGVYFDIVELEQYARQNQTPSTPAVSLCYALATQLDAIVDEGIEARWQRHGAMATCTQDWVASMQSELGPEIGVLAPEGHRSPTVSTITMPSWLPSRALVDDMRKRGFTIATGYGKLKDRTIRIGHMGDHTVPPLARCLDACGDALRAAYATRAAAANVG